MKLALIAVAAWAVLVFLYCALTYGGSERRVPTPTPPVPDPVAEAERLVARVVELERQRSRREHPSWNGET